MNYHHQLELLVDILENQTDENYGTHDEYEQVERLVNSLLQNNAVPQDIKSALMDVGQFASQHDHEGQRGNFSKQELNQYVQKIQSIENGYNTQM
ncbi:MULTISPECIES: YtzH-like family protein [Bacillaceae]|uniref:YtzH-like family protein n=1 Tax=Evansella alkalicola TaxID=745819 RepID=A0ABS6JS56_9BACI|nr:MULTISPECIES: YtzH-like family protein [Bacillaceae]MBU9721072.1 YtzH-like family protein [Bacillus alkalicola]